MTKINSQQDAVKNFKTLYELLLLCRAEKGDATESVHRNSRNMKMHEEIAMSLELLSQDISHKTAKYAIGKGSTPSERVNNFAPSSDQDAYIQDWCLAMDVEGAHKNVRRLAATHRLSREEDIHADVHPGHESGDWRMPSGDDDGDEYMGFEPIYTPSCSVWYE
jgi:hypothetical protein